MGDFDLFDHLDLNLGNLDDLDSAGASAFGDRAFDHDGFIDESGLHDDSILVEDSFVPEGLDPRIYRKAEVARIAQDNRDAASPEQRELANRLSVTLIQDLHTAHASSSHRGSCISCARILSDYYKQNGSNIYFAMIDSRWPRFICKHLKTSYRCLVCDGLSLCKHGKERFRCPMCGNAMCHDPTHVKYRRFKPLRKNKCPGCKAVKMNANSVSQGGGSIKRKYYLTKRKYTIKKRHSIKKRRRLSVKRN